MGYPRVIGGRMVLEVHKPEDITVGGIVLPQSSQDPSDKGTVVSVGKGTRLDNGTYFPLEVAIGDLVIFPRGAGAPIETDDGKSLLILNERDVLAIITE